MGLSCSASSFNRAAAFPSVFIVTFVFKILEIGLVFIFDSEVGVGWGWFSGLLIRIFSEVVNCRNELLLTVLFYRRIIGGLRKIVIHWTWFRLHRTSIRTFLAHLKFFLLNLDSILLDLELPHIGNQLRKILRLVLTHIRRSQNSWLLHFLPNVVVGSVFKRRRRLLFSRLDYFVFRVFVTVEWLLFITWSVLIFIQILLFLKLGVIALDLIVLLILLWIFTFFTNIWLALIKVFILSSTNLRRIKCLLLKARILLFSIGLSLIVLPFGCEALVTSFSLLAGILVLFEIWFGFF